MTTYSAARICWTEFGGVQVGGDHQDLLAHIQAVQLCPSFGNDIDFKLARSAGAESPLATRESHFDSLQITICKVSPFSTPSLQMILVWQGAAIDHVVFKESLCINHQYMAFM